MEDLLGDFIKHITKLYIWPDHNIKTDKEVIKKPQIKLSKALMALQKLYLYKKQQSNSNRNVITTL